MSVLVLRLLTYSRCVSRSTAMPLGAATEGSSRTVTVGVLVGVGEVVRLGVGVSVDDGVWDAVGVRDAVGVAV
jgi:hypothetical protein